MYNRDENDRITFDLPLWLSRRLRHKAKKEGMSISDIIRMILKDFFK